jgi:hypothetical protein
MVTHNMRQSHLYTLRNLVLKVNGIKVHSRFDEQIIKSGREFNELSVVANLKYTVGTYTGHG